MEQFEQLLTCCICLDRYRNPKLLPCQHSFCCEPCMDGLTDYVRRQVKCPECRAEHRIPYNGVQGFPTNVTLQRFLELHIEITGDLPDPLSGQVMERCNVCSEKSYCSICMHCEKKICGDCKSAHMDILRREINRINNQIRRGVHRLQDILSLVEKNTQSLQNNSQSVIEEIDEMYRRMTKAIKDRTDYLRTEIDKYLTTEMKNLTTLKENLELEIFNITSNSDMAEKYMNDSVSWEDCELMDTKEIFLKTVEFIRNFECENSDYSRRVRFSMGCDANQLVNNLVGFGDLNFVHPPSATQSSVGLAPPSSGLMRSKSDHRLVSQFRQQQEQSNDDLEVILGGRKFGERPPKAQEKHDSRYGYDYNNDDQHYDSSRTGKNRFRSRFVRGHHEEEDDNESRTVKGDKDANKDKVTSTEEASKGPLSGIFRILDSPLAMKRIQDMESGPKEKKVEPKPVAPVVVQSAQIQPVRRPPTTTARQVSEDDEIAKIKRENKAASSSTPVAPIVVETERSERPASILKKNPAPGDDSTTTDTTSRVSTTSAASPKTPPAARSSSESSAESSSEASTSAAKSPVESPTSRSTRTSTTPTNSTTPTEEKKPFQSRFLQSGSTTPTSTAPAAKKEESESSEEETSSEEESETEEEAKVTTTKTTPVTRPSVLSKPDTAPITSTRTGILKNTPEERRSSREEPSSPTSRVSSSSRYESPTSTYGRSTDRDDTSSRYGTARTRTTSTYEPEEPSSYTSRFLNKSKSSALSSQPSDEQDDDSDSRYGTGKSRYSALKDRRNRLARSRSSHNFGGDDDDDEPLSPTTTSPSAYLASRYGTSSLSSGSELSRSRSTHALKSRESSPTDRGGSDGDKEALSSWARYLKNKYGNRSTKDAPATTSSTASASSYTPSSSSVSSSPSTATARRLSLGLPLRQANELHSSDDDSKNLQSSLVSPTQPPAQLQVLDDATEDTNTKFSTPRTQYLQKRKQILQIGGRGSEPCKFTWPRGVSVGPDNLIAVADSSNHRVQVFDSLGTYVKEFGSYGNGDGEFDCLAGVAINRIGQFIIADRYNHRIQVFDPAGRFLRTFGSQGTADGKFNYPWGITTDSMGFIYVCDKENHRIQVFQSDGTFVGKFGQLGNGEGQLEHPHYIAVSNTNRVIVSDSNNHRIQIFDVNGKVLSCFGCEGSEEGQFKFPRGIAVDESGYIVVADSGNNRIQIFHPDGSFLRAFGSWGSGDAEFKGLEGVAIMSNGNILVCDRENHRVQIF